MTELSLPTIPRHLSTIKSQEAKELVEEFQAWFSQPDILEKISESAVATRDFLIANEHTPTPQGAIGDPDPWIALEGRSLMELFPTSDEAWIDLRLSALRIKTFAEGVCRMLGILNEMNALPKFAYTYIDTSTNLIEWVLHEKLMRSYFYMQASNGNPDTGSALKLQDLLPAYLYGPGTDAGVSRAKVIQMMSVGLWNATPPQNSREWKIRAGNVAITFHTEVFGPVVKHFRPFLQGKQEDGKDT